MSDDSTTQLEADIAAQRDRLAATVAQLSHKLDVKAQARKRALDLRDRATTQLGRPRPVLVGSVVGLLLLAVLSMWRRPR
jgi:tetrahydromethanopterin S-methyltransferase subunit G